MRWRSWASVIVKLRLLIGSLVVVVLFGAALAAGESADGRARANVTVTVAVHGTGNGRVVDGAGLLRCGIGSSRAANAVCSRTLPEEHFPYHLGVFPEKPSVAAGWTGCDRLEAGGQTCVLIEAYDRTVTATINVPKAPPAPAPRPPGGGGGPSPEAPFTPEEKKALGKVQTIYEAESDIFFGFCGASAILLATPAAPLALPFVIGFGVLGTATRAGGAVMGVLADDPPDRRFRLIARPRVSRSVRIAPGGALGPAAAQRLSRLVNEGLRLNATLAALLHSVERAQGAALAGNRVWVVRQRAAAARYASAAAVLLDRMASFRGAAARAMDGEILQATPSQVRRGRTRVRAVGLSRDVKLALQRAGVTRAAVAEIERGVKRAKLPRARVRFPAVLLDPRLRQAERNAARTLRRLATRIARTP